MSKHKLNEELRKINEKIDKCVLNGTFNSKRCIELRRMHRALRNLA